MEFFLSHVDTCFPDYLVDHHNREGEALFGISVGTNAEDAAAQLLEDISQDERVPEELSSDDLREQAKTVCEGIDWRRVDTTTGERSDEEGQDAADEEQPQVWFLLSWEPQAARSEGAAGEA